MDALKLSWFLSQQRILENKFFFFSQIYHAVLIDLKSYDFYIIHTNGLLTYHSISHQLLQETNLLDEPFTKMGMLLY